MKKRRELYEKLGQQARKEDYMKKEEFIEGCFKLVADEGKIIQSKATHIDEETNKEVADISGETIYLGKNDKQENYIEVDEED